MIQYVCDRCGKAIDKETSKKNYAIYVIRKRNLEKSSGSCVLENPLDLCSDCYKNFSDWLKVRKVERNDKE